MDLIAGLTHGFAALSSPLALTACALGLLGGVIAGFLPGLSPIGGLALASVAVIGLTDHLTTQDAVAFMVAFAYGTLYGRALAAINADAQAANAGAAIARSEWRTLIGALLIGIAAAMVLAATSRTALMARLGPAELSALLMFVLLAGAAFGRGSAASALAMVVIGLLLGAVGDDIETGSPRLTFGVSALEDGFDLMEIALGLFVVANAIDDLVRAASGGETAAVSSKPRGVLPAALIAVLAGFLPTNSETFAATVNARRARPQASLLDPAAQRGVGAIIRAAMLSEIRLTVSLIVLLLLTAPVDAMIALWRFPIIFETMFTKLPAGTVVTLTKPPPDLSPIASLAGATLVLAHIVPLIVIVILARTPWRPIRIDVRVVAPLVVAASCMAAWQWIDPVAVVFVLAFGVAGYGMIRAGFDRSLMFFAFAVSTSLEENIRRTMLIARGDSTVYLQRPIAAAFVIGGVAIFIAVRTWRYVRR